VLCYPGTACNMFTQENRWHGYLADKISRCYGDSTGDAKENLPESKLQRQGNLLLVPNIHSLFTRLTLQFVRSACLKIGLLEDTVLAIVRTEKNHGKFNQDCVFPTDSSWTLLEYTSNVLPRY
jgi:hypothetical protein